MKKTILYLVAVLALAIPKTVCAFPGNVEGDGEPQEGAGAVHHSESPAAPVFSPQQQLLLSRWEQGKIGNKAWSLLGSDNPNRAAVLLGAIQEQDPAKTVDIFYLGFKDFTIVTDPVKAGESFVGGTVIDRIYMF